MIFKVKKLPKLGDKRTVRRFAWLPIRMEGDGLNVLVWLSFVEVSQTFKERYDGSEHWYTTKTALPSESFSRFKNRHLPQLPEARTMKE